MLSAILLKGQNIWFDKVKASGRLKSLESLYYFVNIPYKETFNKGE